MKQLEDHLEDNYAGFEVFYYAHSSDKCVSIFWFTLLLPVLTIDVFMFLVFVARLSLRDQKSFNNQRKRWKADPPVKSIKISPDSGEEQDKSLVSLLKALKAKMLKLH